LKRFNGGGVQILAQLYTLRAQGGLADQLRLVRACGFSGVELVGFHDLTPQQVVAALAEQGVRARSVHFEWDAFETGLDEIIAYLTLLECPVAVMPWLEPQMRPASLEDWNEAADQLQRWSDELAAHDIRLAYHNHEFELTGDAGQLPMDVILSRPGLCWQPDIGWLVAAHPDPGSLLRKYADRIVSAHLKDTGPALRDWRDLGEGRVDWTDVLRLLEDSSCADLIVEHDNPTDPRRTLETGLRFLKRSLPVEIV